MIDTLTPSLDDLRREAAELVAWRDDPVWKATILRWIDRGIETTYDTLSDVAMQKDLSDLRYQQGYAAALRELRDAPIQSLERVARYRKEIEEEEDGKNTELAAAGSTGPRRIFNFKRWR